MSGEVGSVEEASVEESGSSQTQTWHYSKYDRHARFRLSHWWQNGQGRAIAQSPSDWSLQKNLLVFSIITEILF